MIKAFLFFFKVFEEFFLSWNLTKSLTRQRMLYKCKTSYNLKVASLENVSHVNELSHTPISNSVLLCWVTFAELEQQLSYSKHIDFLGQKNIISCSNVSFKQIFWLISSSFFFFLNQLLMLLSLKCSINSLFY